MSIAPSGRQHEIRHGEQTVVVVEVGGGVREYKVGDRPVLDPYPLGAMCDGAHGSPLVPWPNRLADGRYRFDGVDYQVAITEPDKGNAIHGLLRWRSWDAVREEPNRVTMGTRLHPLTGYPFLLDIEVDYLLDDDGLTVATTATNRGERSCPYGTGQHPYLSPGSGVIDDAVLSFTADTRVVTDPTRQLPTGVEPVAGSRFDFSEARRLGELRIDYAFTDLARDEAGRAWVRLEGPDGHRAELWVDGTYPIVELYTGDTLSPDRRRLGLGAEPMTCPPNAFQSGQGVRRLAPGEAVTTRWGARLVAGAARQTNLG
ncbi:MAG: aldose 1-epimerase family protein [Pseudonocardiaceae bacterium]|jgi:aldose 1-epimerase|nr:aldose 1-epimerase family protein [Pseudonocardiaceae bacterium]